MATNLMDVLTGYFNDSTVNKLASQIGESPEATRKAVQAGVPSILAGLLQQTGSSSGAGQVVDMMKGQDWGKMLDGVGGMLGQGPLPEPAPTPGTGSLGGILSMGQSLLKLLFSNKLSGILSMLGMLTGLKGGAMSSLLGLMAPLILGNLGKVLGGMGGGINANNLISLLGSNKDAILKAAPQGLASAMGLASLNDLGKGAADAVRGAADTAKGYATTTARAAETAATGGMPGWLLPLLGLAALALIAYALLGRGGQPAPEAEGVVAEPPPVVAPAPVDVVAPVVDAAKETIEAAAAALPAMELPGGIKLDLPAASPLVGVVDYLKTAVAGAEPKSFNLAGLDFDGATTTVAPASTSMLEALGKILTAFTDAKAKIVAHTTSSGDAAADTQLATDRVTMLKDLLTKAGVGAERIEVEGAGSAGEQPTNWIELLLSK